MKKHLEGPALKLDHGFTRLPPNLIGGHSAIQFHNEDSLTPQGIQKGDIIVAGKDFGGFGEGFPEALKVAGVASVIAASFSRAFYRTCINSGLPLIENTEAFNKISNGEIIAIDFESGEIICKKGTLTFTPNPEIIARILASGGLIPHIKRSLGK